MPISWSPPSLLRLGCLLVILATCGCQSVSYYTQAVRGQYQLWKRQQPIKTLLAAEDTPPALKERLALVLQIRQFAETELKLPANGHYLKYADLQRRFVVWNVYAAPEFSMTPKSWWYPVVGSLEYRGYFSEEKARAHAAELQADGFDTYLGGVTAYSTLGWFRDPLLNTFIHEPEANLADLLFHELAHQRLFIRGDTEFNEAFATAVAEEGTRRWMESRTNQTALAEYHRQSRRTAEFVALVAHTRSQLDTLYTNATAPLATNDSHHQERTRRLRLEKQRIMERLRQGYADVQQRWGGQREYDLWFNQPLNNAQINTVDTYYKLVPELRRLLRTLNGDLEKFFAVMESLRKMKKEERRIRLARLASHGDQAASE